MRSRRSPRTLLVLVLVVASLFEANAHATPANDNFESATRISTIPYADDTPIDGATLELFEPQPSCNLSGALAPLSVASIWYRYEPPDSGLVRADTIESRPYTILAAYKGTDLRDLEEIGCNDGDDLADRHLDLALMTGSTYFFQVSVYSPMETGNVHFSLQPTVASVHSLVEIRPFSVTASDGVVLRGHVYLPDGARPIATILEYSPYWNTTDGPSEGEVEERGDGTRTMPARYLHKWFLEAGFAVALINVRGTGESGGCVHYGDVVDQSDVATVVEALAAADWSNGSVGMTGISYSAWTQYWALAAAPPSLKAVIPVSGIIDPWSYLTRQGAPVATGPTYTTERLLYMGVGVGTNGVPDTSPHHVACPIFEDHVKAGIDLARSGNRTAWFEERDLRPKLATSHVPALISHGLLHFTDLVAQNLSGDASGPSDGGHLTQLDGVWDLLRGDKHMLLGQWGHRYPLRGDFPAMAVGWFDHYLRGAPESVASDVVEFQDDIGAWHTDTQWPPRTMDAVLYLSGQALDSRQSDVRLQQTFQGLGTPCVGFCPVPYPLPAIPIAIAFTGPRLEMCAGDQAIYVSPPLAHDIVLAGQFTADLTVTSNLSDGNLSAYLWHTSGSAACPDPGVKEVRRSVVSLRHWQDQRGRDFPVGVPTPVTLRSWAFANVIPAGHRLVLAIGADSWGLFPKVRPALTITTGPEAAGTLRLPIVGGSLRLVGGAPEG